MRQNQKIMKVQLLKNSHANITFNTNAKVTIRGEQSYIVKWYRDEEYIGEMEGQIDDLIISDFSSNVSLNILSRILP